MPSLKVKNNNGKWLDIASANAHQHTTADITDLPGDIVADVAALKDKVGSESVAYQIQAAVGAVNVRHPSTHPASMITGLADIAVSGSFNDLKDIPDNFGTGGSVSTTEKVVEYDFAVSGVPTVKFDNELLGLTCYKVSNELPSLEELQGAVMVQNYDPEYCEDCVATVDVAEAMFANEEVFISPQYTQEEEGSGAYQSYVFAVSYVTGDVTVTAQGYQMTLTIPETGVYVIYDLGSTPTDTWKFSLTYKKKLSSIPEFDLVAMGLPTILPDGSLVVAEDVDTAEIRAAAAKGICKFKLSLANIPIEAVTGLVYIPMADYYCYTGMTYYNSIPFVIMVDFHSNYISAHVVPLAVANLS